METKRNVLTMYRHTTVSKDKTGKRIYGSFWTVDVFQYFDQREAKHGAEILSNESGIYVVELIPDSEIPEDANIHDCV